MKGKKIVRLPIWVGNLLESVGLATGITSLFAAMSIREGPLRLGLIFIGWVFLWAFSHCLAHYVVGRALGIKFKYYFLGPSSLYKLKLPLVSKLARMPFVPGLRVERGSLKRAGGRRAALMFSSGAIASMSLPLLAAASAVWLATGPFAAFVLAISLGNILFTLYFSPKVGDLSRAMRALKVLREA